MRSLRYRRSVLRRDEGQAYSLKAHWPEEGVLVAGEQSLARMNVIQ